ncbi:unnamed protein product [Sympodiomycopsis kandeliae]
MLASKTSLVAALASLSLAGSSAYAAPSAGHTHGRCALTGSNVSVVRHNGGHQAKFANATQYDILWGNTSKKNPPCEGDPVFAIGLVSKGASRPNSILSTEWVSGGLVVQGNDFETLLALPGTAPGDYTAHYFQYDPKTGHAYADATTHDFTFHY